MRINKLVLTGVFASASMFSAQAFAQGAALGGPEGEAAAAAPAEAAPAPAPAPAANPQVAAFVDQQFPNADADKNGTVTAAEFTTWITGLKTAEQQKAGSIDAAAAKTYADGALAKADADKDGTLSKPELITFFGG